MFSQHVNLSQRFLYINPRKIYLIAAYISVLQLLFLYVVHIYNTGNSISLFETSGNVIVETYHQLIDV